ncbi:phosphatase PAP2 family protein [Candidatus Woesearchaeota archaeon]|nr:MAG: phosphatase PAP2 family protein [Candidatus Woesearchaeota archaeon]
MLFKELVEDVKAFGGLPAFVLVIFVFWALGNFKFAAILLAGLLIAFAITVAIRSIWFRSRPDGTGFNSFLTRLSASSFPSLHATRAALLSSLLAFYFDNLLISAVLFLCAVCTAWARVFAKRHHTSDVIVGLVIGFALAFVLVRTLLL